VYPAKRLAKTPVSASENSLAENEEYKRIVPGDIQQKLTDIANKIASGEIVVKSYFDE
jgi:hypothetical protein